MAAIKVSFNHSGAPTYPADYVDTTALNDVAPGDTSTAVQSTTPGASATVWAVWDLGVSAQVTRWRCSTYTAGGYGPPTFECSDDGATWITASTGPAPFGATTYTVDTSHVTTASHRYWRCSQVDNAADARISDYRIYDSGGAEYAIQPFPPILLSQLMGIGSGERLDAGGILVSFGVLIQRDGIGSAEAIDPGGSVYRWGIMVQADGIPSAEQFGTAGAIVIAPYVLLALSIGSGEALDPGGQILMGPIVLTSTGSGIASAEEIDAGGSIQRSGGLFRRPFLNPPAPYDQLTPSELAATTGIAQAAFEGFFTSIPAWQLEMNIQGVALALSVDPDHLRALVRQARNQIASRAGVPDPNLTSRTSMGGMKPH